jgi:hypothetical protein
MAIQRSQQTIHRTLVTQLMRPKARRALKKVLQLGTKMAIQRSQQTINRTLVTQLMRPKARRALKKVIQLGTKRAILKMRNLLMIRMNRILEMATHKLMHRKARQVRRLPEMMARIIMMLTEVKRKLKRKQKTMVMSLSKTTIKMSRLTQKT